VPLAPQAVPASLDEGSAIDAENRQLLAAMTAEQVEEAREEAMKRLPPAAIEFLRRRGAERAKAAATPAAGSAAGAGQAGPAAAQPRGVGVQHDASSLSGSRRLAERPGQQQQQLAPAGPLNTSRASLAARLRFSIDGSVVGLRPADAGSTEVAPADVAQRDPIR